MFAWYEKHECIFSKWYIKKNQPSLYMYLRWCNEIYLENPVQYHLIIGKSCINNGYFIKDFSFTSILNSVSLKTCIWYTILNWPNNPQKKMYNTEFVYKSYFIHFQKNMTLELCTSRARYSMVNLLMIMEYWWFISNSLRENLHVGTICESIHSHIVKRPHMGHLRIIQWVVFCKRR